MTRPLKSHKGWAQERISFPLTWYAVALAFIQACVLLKLIAQVAVSTPFQDELLFGDLYSSLASGGFPSLRELLAAHHGHPYLILKLLIALTVKLELPWTWMMYAQVPVAVCTLILLSLRITARDLASRVLVFVGLSLVVLTPRQWENLYWSMQLAFPLFLLASIGAMDSTTRFSQSRQLRWLILALCFSLIATITNGAGVFTLVLVAGALVALRLDFRGFVIVGTLTSIGFGLFILSQMLSTGAGVGSQHLSFTLAAEHVLRMFAHQVADFSLSDKTAIAIGVLAVFIAGYCVLRASRQWHAFLFELLCIILSTTLILGITYARVAAGVFQPNAPRYLPLIAPLSIGSLLLFHRWGKRLALAISVIALSLGYVTALRSEWLMGPYRYNSLTAAHFEVCTSEEIHQSNVEVSGSSLRDIQRLFCHTPAFSLIDHSSIQSTIASGYFREVAQTWIAPNFKVRMPTTKGFNLLTATGWIPDLDSYATKTFTIQVLANGKVISIDEIRKPGQFSLSAVIPPETNAIQITASSRKKIEPDVRELSWILISITLKETDARGIETH